MAGLEIYISRQWTIGPPALEIWWSSQISGGLGTFWGKIKHRWQNLPAPIQLQDFGKYLAIHTLNFIEKDIIIGKKK